ncbi:major facilitator superfamily domain-containing protein [Limtongia smithiae]|uniref:major facilitator superfamily domain-containing protein n=1 Tax=Limtongia smithiae TaxID=1125753 RepID=UPI0034CED6C1
MEKIRNAFTPSEKDYDHEVGVEVLPGTEIMRDENGRAVAHLHNEQSGAVLVPQPSENLDDPLNWSPIWKWIVLINQGCFVLISVITNLSLAPLDNIYILLWNKSATHVALLTGATVLSLGYANFIIVPTAELYGRRFVTLVCGLVCLGGDIWQAAAQSYNSFLGARIITGLGAAINESLLPMIITDMFFLHERGKYVGVYFCCYFNGLFLGPIISGGVAQHVSWRWFFWACAIVQGFNVLSLLFLFPETRYTRERQTHLPLDTNTPAASVEESATMKPSTEAAEHMENFDTENGIAVDSSLGRGKPTKAQFKLIQPIDRHAWKTIARHVITPFNLIFFPIIALSIMVMGGAANALLMINLLQSAAFTASPYNFNTGAVGLTNFALVVGGTIALLTAGPVSDWIAKQKTMRNNGIREPEMRLIALAPLIVMTVVSMVIIGVGWDRGWDWRIVVILGFGFLGYVVVALPTVSITYAVDCYKPVSGEIMVIATVCKNTFGFGSTYFANNWAVASGYNPPVMLLMGITAGSALVLLVFFTYFGKTMRRLTKNHKVHSL